MVQETSPRAQRYTGACRRLGALVEQPLASSTAATATVILTVVRSCSSPSFLPPAPPCHCARRLHNRFSRPSVRRAIPRRLEAPPSRGQTYTASSEQRQVRLVCTRTPRVHATNTPPLRSKPRYPIQSPLHSSPPPPHRPAVSPSHRPTGPPTQCPNALPRATPPPLLRFVCRVSRRLRLLGSDEGEGC